MNKGCLCFYGQDETSVIFHGSVNSVSNDRMNHEYKLQVVRNRKVTEVTMLWFYARSVEDIRCDVEVSVFLIEMFGGTKRAELITIIETEHEVLWIEYKVTLCIRRQTTYSRK